MDHAASGRLGATMRRRSRAGLIRALLSPAPAAVAHRGPTPRAMRFIIHLPGPGHVSGDQRHDLPGAAQFRIRQIVKYGDGLF